MGGTKRKRTRPSARVVPLPTYRAMKLRVAALEARLAVERQRRRRAEIAVERYEEFLGGPGGTA